MHLGVLRVRLDQVACNGRLGCLIEVEVPPALPGLFPSHELLTLVNIVPLSRQEILVKPLISNLSEIAWVVKSGHVLILCLHHSLIVVIIPCPHHCCGKLLVDIR